MANINLYDLYNRKVRKFGITDSPNFREYFVDAVNLVYSELNEKVFQADTLQPIGAFNDIIDTRLAFFTSITFDHGVAPDSDAAISNREFWRAEYDFERTSATNGFTDTIADDYSDVVISIANGVLTVTGSAITATATLPTSTEIFTVAFESYADGNKLLINDEPVTLTYSVGDADTPQEIGTVSSNVINGVSGLELKATRFYTDSTKVYEFLLDEETTSTNLTDEIAGYTATIVDDQWDERYIENSTSLDNRYRSSFEMGLDFHIQDGGQWGLEDDGSRERKWYSRGIRSARSAYQQLTTYVSPLNPSGS